MLYICAYTTHVLPAVVSGIQWLTTLSSITAMYNIDQHAGVILMLTPASATESSVSSLPAIIFSGITPAGP